MIPHYSDDWLTLYGGDCREVLASLPADSVDCVVTSPPYWGLRDYGTEGQLGLERTPEEYVANMVAVFREVRRVLKPSGTCWLNLGDSYASSGVAGPLGKPNLGGGGEFFKTHGINEKAHGYAFGRAPTAPGLKPKDLVGIPWRVAFALQADGWYLRSDIIWSKPNPMPESVTDRPTKSHEYLFLLTKSARYYFDADAVRESYSPASEDRYKYAFGGEGYKSPTKNPAAHPDGVISQNPAGRNIRSVWTIATRPYPGAHFAVFPPDLPERCIKAGSSEKGVCTMTVGGQRCGAPWERVVDKGAPYPIDEHPEDKGRMKASGEVATDSARRSQLSGSKHAAWKAENPDRVTGWRPSCGHESAPPRPAVILDPFGGSGTVGMVANRLSRRAILIDLNPEYVNQQMKRNAQTPLGLDAA